MIIFLYGEDTYRLREKLNQLKNKFIKEIDPTGGNIFVFDEDNVDSDKLKSSFFTISFLVKKKMVILERIGNFKKKISEEINNWFKKLDEDKNLILIIWDESIESKPSKNKSDLISQLKKTKYSYEFPLLSDQKLKAWAEEEIEKKGGRINNEALDLLISHVGSDLWQMSQEISKLVSFKNKETINKDDVKLLTKARLDENIFHLVDAVGNKDKKMALRLINEQIESGISPIYLVTMLIRQFKILLQVKDVLENEKNSYNIASEFSLHPFVIKKAVSQSQKYTLEELKKIYSQILDIDLKSKTTQLDPQVLLNLFVAKLA